MERATRSVQRTYCIVHSLSEKRVNRHKVNKKIETLKTRRVDERSVNRHIAKTVQEEAFDMFVGKNKGRLTSNLLQQVSKHVSRRGTIVQ
jgi:hypothetical protein